MKVLAVAISLSTGWWGRWVSALEHWFFSLRWFLGYTRLERQGPILSDGVGTKHRISIGCGLLIVNWLLFVFVFFILIIEKVLWMVACFFQINLMVLCGWMLSFLVCYSFSCSSRALQLLIGLLIVGLQWFAMGVSISTCIFSGEI